VRIFVFLHVLTMFGAVAFSGGIDTLLLSVARTGDVRAIRTAFEAHRRFEALIPAAFVTGLIFGLIAIFAEGFNPFQAWLLLAYPLFVLGILVGALGLGRWTTRVRLAAADAPDGGSPALAAALADPTARRAFIVFWLLIVAIIFVMITKPLS
jgi:uncharacterized membrane protein